MYRAEAVHLYTTDCLTNRCLQLPLTPSHRLSSTTASSSFQPASSTSRILLKLCWCWQGVGIRPLISHIPYTITIRCIGCVGSSCRNLGAWCPCFKRKFKNLHSCLHAHYKLQLIYFRNLITYKGDRLLWVHCRSPFSRIVLWQNLQSER